MSIGSLLQGVGIINMCGSWIIHSIARSEPALKECHKLLAIGCIIDTLLGVAVFTAGCVVELLGGVA